MNSIKLTDVYNSPLEEYVIELLYRIKLGEEFVSACDVYRSLSSSKYVEQMKIANDFFTTAFEALNIAMMLEIAKLCEEDNQAYSVIKFFNRCQSDKNFHKVISDKCEFNNTLKEFFEFWQSEKIQNIIENIKERRDKYYSHNDKKYFTNIDLLVQGTHVCYEDIKMLFNVFKKFCLKIYNLATGKEWEPHLHQGCFSYQKDCYDLEKLLQLVKNK